MGPPENPTRHHEKQVARRRKRAAARPRSRWCLLKGCEQRFGPQHARQRYCSEGCRKEALKWSEWKARQVCRASTAGKQKRNRQSQRYRKRVQERKALQKEAIPKAARVITKKFFFGDCCDRPGCYECFVRSRRSQRQRFCSHACQRAMERVWERERRWRRRHHFPGRRPCARLP